MSLNVNTNMILAAASAKAVEPSETKKVSDNIFDVQKSSNTSSQQTAQFDFLQYIQNMIFQNIFVKPLINPIFKGFSPEIMNLLNFNPTPIYSQFSMPLTNNNNFSNISNKNYFTSNNTVSKTYASKNYSNINPFNVAKYDSNIFAKHKLEDVYNERLSKDLAETSKYFASQMGGRRSLGYCARGVRQALESAGIVGPREVYGNAHQYASLLASHENFAEVAVNDLTKLPAGCIVVWDKDSRHQYGHIAITQENGLESSDHIQNISNNFSRRGGYRVFVPVKNR